MINFKYNNMVLKIDQDEFAEPTSFENRVGIRFCFHKKYKLGDNIYEELEDFNGWDDVKKYIIKKHKAVAILPLYLYDHSGLAIDTSPFYCGYDSGQIGFVYTTQRQVERYLGKSASKAEINKVLRNEIVEHDNYLRGNIYKFTILKNSKVVECVGGFHLEDEKQMIEKMKMLSENRDIFDSYFKKQNNKEKDDFDM